MMTVNKFFLSSVRWYTQAIMLDQLALKRIVDKLLEWYRDHARDLPWRRTSDPYYIWVSEIMLQQTRVESVIPYYLSWIDRFPTMEDLAKANEEDVLSLWEGLGYYRRAINLHRGVKEIHASYGGIIPEDPILLQKLPGVGPYTAGAIASIAFDQPAPILDGNIRRLFSRLFNIHDEPGTSKAEKIFQEIARDLIPEEYPGDFNQALMELGALVCIPKKPGCDRCPLILDCKARQLGIQDELPIRKEKSPLPHFQVTAAICQSGSRVLLAKRPLKGLLGGMWEYPGGKQEGGESLQEALKREIQEELEVEIKIGDLQGVYEHAYTHYKVTLHAYFCQLMTRDLVLNYHTQIAWVPVNSLQDYPMGKIDRQISLQIHEQH